jgi:mRNA interferase RelE/StbE
MIRAIEERLTKAPEKCGKPLRFILKGLRSLRIGAYRVIYSIQPSYVWIMMMGHRRDVYAMMESRLKRLT